MLSHRNGKLFCLVAGVLLLLPIGGLLVAMADVVNPPMSAGDGDKVVSVNGSTGVVVVTASSISAAPLSLSNSVFTTLGDPCGTITNILGADTVTLTRAMGSRLALVLTTNTTLTADTSYPTNMDAAISLGIHLATYSLTLDTNVMMFATNYTLLTNNWNYFMMYKGYGSSIWVIR